MKDHEFRIGHFPQYTANRELEKDLKWIKDQGPLSGGLTEMANRKDDVLRTLGSSEKAYRVFYGDQNHGGRPIEIPMILNREAANTPSYDYIPISPGIPGVSFVKPRGISVLRYRYKGRKVAHIHTHWDAVLQNKTTGAVVVAKRVEFAKANSQRIEALASRLKKEDFAVFISGDFNYRDFPALDRFRLWTHSPQTVFKRLGLSWKDDRLDYLAFDPQLVKLVDYTVVRPNSPGNHGDHPYMIGDFAWKA